ncbi:AEC family transporter [Curtobacterium sp. MCBD17_013]|uniref:AEC family transporter n=1 Tax=unclassified Curtobacterium TaxID=257496 RepID=UPI000DAAAD72|nr:MULTISPECIES: AEC family transporter [unclassified Curtobacterium]PZF63676.1 AEC family transporter [Curtobacterium sp. MCBD17_013]WIB67932.1 AEC family transporter [Curtobacterium sp. MCBD17_035]
MSGVLIGFAIIGVVIATGYLVGRLGVLGPHAQFVMSRLVFFVLTPCLLFHTIATADIHVLLSEMLVVSLVTALVVALGTAAVFRFVLRRDLAQTTVGALAAGYVNSNNIGLPVAVYVLGHPAYVVPVILLQLVVLAPIALTILDTATSSGGGLRRRILGPVSNPLIIASLLGLVVSLTGVRIPDPVMEPFSLVGAAAVPVVLLSFGMSLHGNAPFRDPDTRVDVVVASALKLFVMPVLAYVIARFVFHVSHEHLFVLTVLAGLPTAQNVFNYAQRYDAAVPVARDVVLVSTIGAVPVLVVVAALLH